MQAHYPGRLEVHASSRMLGILCKLAKPPDTLVLLSQQAAANSGIAAGQAPTLATRK